MNRFVFDSRGLSASREYFMIRRPPFLGLAAWVYLVLLVATIIWASLFAMEDVVRGPIQVHPTEARSTVRNPVAGTVVAVAFADQARVSRGDLLYRIDDQEIQNQLHSLRLQIDLLTEEAAALTTMGRLIAEVQEGTNVIGPERSIEIDQVRRLAGTLPIEQNVPGMTPSVRARWEAFVFDDRQLLNSALDICLDLETKLSLPAAMTTKSEIRALELKVQIGISEWLANRNRTAAAVHSDRLTRVATLNDLAGQSTALEIKRESCTVRAPISGTIFAEREINIGDRIGSDQAVLMIVPDSPGSYQGTIQVKANQMSGLSVGAPVRVAFDALPPSEFGYASGRITRIPPDLTGSSNSQPVFELEAQLPDHMTSRRSGLMVHLHPGLQGEARIVRRTKPVLAFFLELVDFRQ